MVPDFDPERLAGYLRARLPGLRGALTVEPVAGGQSNPTYRLRFAERDLVLRKQPSGELLPSAHAVDREFRVISALNRTDVPTPRAYVLCEDEALIGTAFYVMEYCDGRVLWDPLLPDVPVAERAAYYRSKVETLAKLHRWASRNGRVHVVSERRNDPVNHPIRCLSRAERMAYYRNQYHTYIGNHFPGYDAAIVIDGAGLGSTIAANKIAGARAAMCTNETLARYARQHNGANVLALGATLVSREQAVAIVNIFLETPMREPRYIRRLAKIRDLETRPRG